jgi:hypothetical protein
MIYRLESSLSSSSSTTDTKKERKQSIKQPMHDDRSDGSNSLTSSPPVKRVAKEDDKEKNLTNGTNINHGENFILRQNGSHNEISFRNNDNKFERNREEITNGTRRTTSGTTVSFFFFLF